jgi:hypothetical protein
LARAGAVTKTGPGEQEPNIPTRHCTRND